LDGRELEINLRTSVIYRFIIRLTPLQILGFSIPLIYWTFLGFHLF